jgi:gamma-glutamylcyclotransferase (GGCT)/AIG2-like uncharacterized protein YtfP
VDSEILLFAYGSLLRGEIHERYLIDAIRLGPARTAPGYRLVELDLFPALIASGMMSVDGELFDVTPAQLRHTDELKENGRLFERQVIQLEDGRAAQAYLMSEEKLRGRRRLRVSDWRKRFSSGRR